MIKSEVEPFPYFQSCLIFDLCKTMTALIELGTNKNKAFSTYLNSYSLIPGKHFHPAAKRDEFLSNENLYVYKKARLMGSTVDLWALIYNDL